MAQGVAEDRPLWATVGRAADAIVAPSARGVTAAATRLWPSGWSRPANFVRKSRRRRRSLGGEAAVGDLGKVKWLALRPAAAVIVLLRRRKL